MNTASNKLMNPGDSKQRHCEKTVASPKCLCGYKSSGFTGGKERSGLFKRFSR